MNKAILLISFISFFCLITPIEAEVFTNQAGYLINSKKFVLTDVSADSFYVHDGLSGDKVFAGELSTWITNDPATELNLYIGEFTTFNTPGSYFIVSSNGDSSFVFGISNTVFQELYNISLKGYYFQRCGIPLDEVNAGEYDHSRCHWVDAFYHPSTGITAHKLSVGGWHDAGDYGKYIVNAGITVGTLLLAYELFPTHFDQDDLNIPESENGIPDLLDEVKYELEWFFKMQYDNGGVHAKLTAENFSAFIMPEDDNSTRYIYEVSSAATADFAAVMAKAARIYSEFNQEFSDSCLEAAESAWQFLEANPNIVPPGGFQNPPGTATGVYGDDNDQDERLWASIELYAATGNDIYHSYFNSHYFGIGLINVMWWQDVRSLGYLTYLNSVENRNPLAEELLRGSLSNLCEEIISLRDENGFRVAMETEEYEWGSNSIPLNKAILLIVANKLFDEEEYLIAALDQLNYMVGMNAHNMSFVTNVGTKRPMNPHHRPSGADNIFEPVPGLLVGGPNKNLEDPVLSSLFNSSTPPALCYVDDEGSYGSNEIAINWNAPLVFVSGYFNKLSSVSEIHEKQENIPTEIKLNQNFPNPFNGSTTIRFSINKSQPIFFKVYDILSKEIYAKILGQFNPGEYSTNWNALNSAGFEINSGIYFYQIKGRNELITRKLIYLK